MATKQARLEEALREHLGAGELVQEETVDFSDPHRPPTCIEVDFPILPINLISAIERNAGKPIYQMSKWWARRNPSIFRAILIAAALKAPQDPSLAAKKVFDLYYRNFQASRIFSHLKVADIFMGGGTTLVEALRLGMEAYGNDLNPIAWLVVKNALSQVKEEEVENLIRHIEEEVKPQIQPFYTCSCPRGHKGKWIHKPTGRAMDSTFSPLSLPPEQRKEYTYEGPEIIYTFHAKHAPCAMTGCHHRTPIFSSLVIAEKKLSVTAYRYHCSCGHTFDVEEKEVRMAPGVPLVLGDGEEPYAVLEKGEARCPYCQSLCLLGDLNQLPKKKKTISLHLLIHPQWLKGERGIDPEGRPYGGSAQDDTASTARWYQVRHTKLRLLEVRGVLPATLTCPETGFTFSTGKESVTSPRSGKLQCGGCGTLENQKKMLEKSGKTAPTAPYAIQGYCPECAKNREAYGGRFFDLPPLAPLLAACREWELRREGDLAPYWPRSEIWDGQETHRLLPIHYTHWWTMFHPRQLLILSLLLKTIHQAPHSWEAKEFLLGAFEQYLRNQNLFCFWDKDYDKLVPFMSNNNYHPKATVVENGVFSFLGRGNWHSAISQIRAGLSFRKAPYDFIAKSYLASHSGQELAQAIPGKSAKIYPGDRVAGRYHLECRSSTDLSCYEDASMDLVVTDPPFGGIMQYSELSDFFYVWLRLVLKERYPALFSSPHTPKAAEVVSNKVRHGRRADQMYRRLLTACWREAYRILKPGGLLVFTFHHSGQEAWLSVLESLFEAGFYLVVTYPIRSDETKGEKASFGSKKIEFDVIHVCRKRLGEPQEISWAKLRRKILEEVERLQRILEGHRKEGLPEADLREVARGKALEYFSRHYGRVYLERGRPFSLREALLAINQILEERETDPGELPPQEAEPATRQFLLIFQNRREMAKDEVQKLLRGTGFSADDFVELGWCRLDGKRKVYVLVEPPEFVVRWKGVPRKRMAWDYDQAMYLTGAAYPQSGVRLDKVFQSPGFVPHKALEDLLDWLSKQGALGEIRDGAALALRSYRRWKVKHEKELQKKQGELFDFS